MPKRPGPARKPTSGEKPAKAKTPAPKPKVAPKPAAAAKSAPSAKANKPVGKPPKPTPPAPKPPAGKPIAGKPAAAPPGKPVHPPGKPLRKGITIVTPKPVKRPSSKAATLTVPSFGSPLLRPGAPRKPLIASGPNAPSPNAMFSGDQKKPRKSPFDKRELAKFKAILLRKRAELVGDISNMESEALKGSSGSLSHLPQHMAEQGSDAYGQSLSLDLAAADRRLIKEIDDALERIEEGTYGICELTGKPIKADRLEELPWARYSIEAARELERRGTLP